MATTPGCCGGICYTCFPSGCGMYQIRLVGTTIVSTADVATDIAFWALLDPSNDELLFGLATAFIFVPITVVLVLELIVVANRCGCFDERNSVAPSDRGSWVWPAVRAILSPVYPLIYLFSEKPIDATEVVDGVPRQAWASQLIELLLEALPQLLVQTRLALLEGRLNNPLYLTSVGAALLSLSDKVFRLRPRGWRASAGLQAAAGIFVCCLCVGGIIPAMLLALLQGSTPVEIAALHLLIAGISAGFGLYGWAGRLSKSGAEALLALCWPSWFVDAAAAQQRAIGRASQRKSRKIKGRGRNKYQPATGGLAVSSRSQDSNYQYAVGRKIAVRAAGPDNTPAPAPPAAANSTDQDPEDPVAAILARMQGTAVPPLQLPSSTTPPDRSSPPGSSRSPSPPSSAVRPARRVFGAQEGEDGDSFASSPPTANGSGSGIESSPLSSGRGRGVDGGAGGTSSSGPYAGQEGGEGDSGEGEGGGCCEWCEDCCEDSCATVQCSCPCCMTSGTRGCFGLAAVIVACISPALVYLPVVVESKAVGAGRPAEAALLMGHNSFFAWQKSLTALVAVGCAVLGSQALVHGLVLSGTASGVSVTGEETGVADVGIQISTGDRASQWLAEGCFDSGSQSGDEVDCDEVASVFVRALMTAHTIVAAVGLAAALGACCQLKGSWLRVLCGVDRKR